MALREEIAEEGFPLAPLLLRVTAAVIDAFLAGLLLLTCYFFCYPHDNFPTLGQALGMEEDWALVEHYLTYSGLMELEEDENGELYPVHDISSTDYHDYEASIRSYYFDYQLIEDISINPNPHQEWASERWYNVNVLGLPSSSSAVNSSPYFSFGLDENGNTSLDVPARLQDSLFEENSAGEMVLTEESSQNLLLFFRNAYAEAQNRLTSESFYQEPYQAYTNGHFITLSVTIAIPFTIIYLLFPLLSKRGNTPGKMIFRLGLLRFDGMPLPRYMLLLRALPLFGTWYAALFANDLIISLTILILMFLISVSLGLLTPKRRALHDYIALSVVTRAWASDRAHEPDFLDIVENGPREEDKSEEEE